jgi:hypothetical protein
MKMDLPTLFVICLIKKNNKTAQMPTKGIWAVLYFLVRNRLFQEAH